MPLLAVLGETSVPFRKTRPPVSELSSKVYLEGALGGFREVFHGQFKHGFHGIYRDFMGFNGDLIGFNGDLYNDI